jgi:hypothetical protein
VTLSEPVLRQLIDYPDSYPMSLLASLNARASVGSGKGRDRTDRLSSLVFAPGQVKTMTSLMLQQDPHSLQLSEALGRSYENRSGGVRGTSFISSVSSDDDQVGNPSVLKVLRIDVDYSCSPTPDWSLTSWSGYPRRRRVMFAACRIM